MKKADMIKEFCAQLAFYGGTVNYVNTHGSKDEFRQHDAIVSIDALMWTAHCMKWTVYEKKTTIFEKEYYVGFAVTDGKNCAEMWCTSCNEGIDDNTYKMFKEWAGEYHV